LALGVVFVLAASTTLPAGDRHSAQSLYDLVAVGHGPGKVLLATLAGQADKLVWRFREIPVSPSAGTVQDVELSVGGTKLLVVFPDGTPRVLDLTKRITGIGAKDLSPPQHRLPQDRFPFLSNGKVCLLDDLGDRAGEDCTDAKGAVVHEDGRVLYALNDGRLVAVAPSGGSQEQLAYRLPQGAPFQLLAGHRGDARDFLVLVNEFQGQLNGKTGDPITKIVDPRLPGSPLGLFANSTVAALRAQLDFVDPGESGASRAAHISDATLATLAARLDQKTRSSEFVWSFYRLTVNTELYAPVLESAPGEPDYPNDVEIWQEIRPLAHGASRKAYQAAYASLGDRRWSRCTSYVRTISYPGTWLIEYWFYYPFDEGPLHPHIHDSEHIFVEVDKLGGTVRNFFASDHDSFVPNNLYSTLVKDSPPVTLPLFAMVELGKHAMAPDLNHDGHFTRGVDDNLHPDPYSFWGLRDRGSMIRSVMAPYMSSMSLPRPREGRFALAVSDDLFPGVDVPLEHQVCRLRPFPDDPPCLHCDTATQAAATTYLVHHPDALVPENIYKPYVLPWREVRVGFGIYSWAEGREQLSLALVGDFRHMTGGLVSMPARLALEYIWVPVVKLVPGHFDSRNQFLYSKSTMMVGARVERLITNTQGFYFGVTPEWADLSTPGIGGAGSPPTSHWEYGGVSYHIGYVLELPSAHKSNLTNHVGVVIREGIGHRALFEWRVSFGLWRQRGRHSFGARSSDRNPYE
jgi:hypothetical protein